MNQINICGCISAFTKQRGNVSVSQIFFIKINEITVTIKKKPRGNIWKHTLFAKYFEKFSNKLNLWHDLIFLLMGCLFSKLSQIGLILTDYKFNTEKITMKCVLCIRQILGLIAPCSFKMEEIHQIFFFGLMYYSSLSVN